MTSNNFDFLRLFAATLVLVSHCYPLFGRGAEFVSQLIGFQTGGGIAVYIFFFMSGFLLTGSLEKQPALWKFAVSRALRILPALCVVVLLSVLVLGPAMTHLSRDEYFRDPRTLGYLLNTTIFQLRFSLPGVFSDAPNPSVNGSVWTLPIEVLMYLLLGLFYAVGLLGRRFSLLISTLFFAAFVMIQTYMHWDWGHRGPVALSVPLFDFVELGTWFFIGSAFRIYQDRIPVSHEAALAACILLLASLWSPGVVVVSIVSISYLTYYIAHCPLPLWRLTAPIGDISYGVYLYAFPVQQTVYELAHERFGFFEMMGMALVVTYVLAWLSWNLVERPMLSLKPR